MSVYTLKKHKTSGELHLFKGSLNPPGSKTTCTSEYSSECNEMTYGDGIENKFACESEDKARKLIAVIGRPVCGTCVSTLYTTKKK